MSAFIEHGTAIEEEHILDTAVDLYVYAVKYVLFLAEHDAELGRALPLSQPIGPLSDHKGNFDALLDAHENWQHSEVPVTLAVERVTATFELLWPAVESDESIKRRFDLAAHLAETARQLVLGVAQAHPIAAAAFVDREFAIRGA